MQLGELQNQIERFERRSATIVGISVDAPTDSLAMIERLGLTFPLGSDPDQEVVRAFGVQNPDTRELALHAVYIVEPGGHIVYRKVARRRPVSAELIDALDAHAGVFPQHDPAAPPARIAVAYPRNNFQALVEMAGVEALPAGIDGKRFSNVQQLVAEGRSDDALFAFKALVESSLAAGSDALFDAAAWLVRERFFANNEAAMTVGLDLRRRLARVAELEARERAIASTAEHDEVLHALAAARAGLTRVRATVSNQAEAWNLRYAKASLRGYREVVRAVLRSAGEPPGPVAAAGPGR